MFCICVALQIDIWYIQSVNKIFGEQVKYLKEKEVAIHIVALCVDHGCKTNIKSIFRI